MASVEMHNFEEELTCSICYSIFEDPRVLPCSHTFCRNCLENILQASGNFYVRRALRIPLTCPNCRRTVEIPPPGIESLPINFALRAIIEKYQQEGCLDVITCPEHSRQPLNIYCLQDREPVCGHCLTIGQHQGHPIEDLHSAYMKEKEEPSKLFEQLTDINSHWEDFWLLAEKLLDQKSHVMQVVQNDKEIVLRYFKELNDILDLKKDALLSALDDVGRAIDEEFTPQIDRMTEIRVEQMELRRSTALLLEEESTVKFLKKICNVRQRVQALRQRTLPSIQSLEICPRVGPVLMEEWARTEISQIKNLVVPEIKLSLQRMQSVPAKEEKGVEEEEEEEENEEEKEEENEEEKEEEEEEDEKEEEEQEEKEEEKAEFAKIFSIFILTVISGILMLIFLFNRYTLPILHDVSSGFFSEVSQSLYHSFSNNMYIVKETVCLTYHVLKGFLWDSISCCL
uniref:Tripartite motif-containing protein 59 n=1 Tax=Monodelphis domestica TaxID=13616 RepID=A0A5F8GAQ4_MONDO